MEKTLKIINQMRRKKVIADYAIGGAVATIFYVEPILKIKTKVLKMEHLLAIMLQTDRPKDRARITQLMDETKINMKNFLTVLKRHNLMNK